MQRKKEEQNRQSEVDYTDLDLKKEMADKTLKDKINKRRQVRIIAISCRRHFKSKAKIDSISISKNIFLTLF